MLEITKDDGLTIVAPSAHLTYTLVVTNSGNQAATGVVMTDTLPEDTTFVSASDGGDYDADTGIITWPAFNLAATAGSNSRSFSVEVQVVAAPVGTVITNNVHVEDDGTNTEGTPVEADASDSDQIAASGVKSLIDSDQPGSTLPNVLIGEILTYQINLTVPSGEMQHLKAVDTLDKGLAFVGCEIINAGGLSTSLSGGFEDACNDPTNPTVSAFPAGMTGTENLGRVITFDLGSVSNAGEEAATLSIQYQVVVLNIAANVDGTGDLNNAVTWSWDGGTLEGTAEAVDVVEPKLSIAKQVMPSVATFGTTVTFTIDIAHTSESTAPAYNVTIQDTLPAGFTYVPATLQILSGPAGGVADESAPPVLKVNWANFGLDDTAEISFQAVYHGPNDAQNVASVVWTSLPETPGQLTPYNPAAIERTYQPGDNTVNDYEAESSATVSYPRLLPNTGFAAGRVSVVPAQPADQQYQAMDGMWLEIPRLNLKMSIVGIPLNFQGKWDLTWLSSQAGYLQGTTYPGQKGTTGLTGHVYLADGTPGPFVDLGKLAWGNQVVLHANGEVYTFEVRTVSTVSPNDLSVFSNDGYTWLTLLTCQDYNASQNSYAYRTAVRAVLVKVETEQ